MGRVSSGTIAIVVVCVAAIAGGVWLMVRKAEIGGPREPEWRLNQTIERIDQNTLTVITKTRREWEALGSKEGRYRNPESREYTMVEPMVCPFCKGKIPTPFIELGPEARDESPEPVLTPCPRCKKMIADTPM